MTTHRARWGQFVVALLMLSPIAFAETTQPHALEGGVVRDALAAQSETDTERVFPQRDEASIEDAVATSTEKALAIDDQQLEPITVTPVVLTEELPFEITSSQPSVDSRISQLEAELAGLRSTLRCVQKSKSTPCRCAGFDAGFSLFFAKPQMKESFQATVVDAGSGVLGLVPFSFDYEVTPRVWFGYVGKTGTGVRARYWQYDQDANPLTLTATPSTFPGVSSVTVIFPAAITTQAAGEILSVTSGLKVQTIDIEGVMRREFAGADLTVNAGFRWASMDQNFNSVIATQNPQAPVGGVLNWSRRFEGGGLTVGAEGNKSLGGTAWSAVGSARGSLLYGEKEMRRTVLGDVTPTPTPPFVAFDDADEVSGIFELLAGLRWSRSTKRCGNLFVQGMYETQLWTAAGAPTLTFLGFDGFNLSFGLER